MSGLFITFEGLDGSGKSTQLKRVAADLERRGVAHVVTREPGGTPFADLLRELFLRHEAAQVDGVVELMLVFASRRQHLIEVIEPAVAADAVVLCDRFTDSTYAYQGGGRGVPRGAIEEADRLATGCRTPDRTLFFELSPEEAQRRRREGATDRIDRESLAFYRRVHEAYGGRIAAEPERFRVIDATASIDDVARAVESALGDLLRPLSQAAGA
ncbi:MAG: dTMP kinase [Acidobacteriota bacterium]|nr:dTMP kinase [Acidobacteriota bacterium]MDE3263531.1 dTMP kinase [Acidobacteriota bacterium]